jgi:hypothetical protein
VVGDSVPTNIEIPAAGGAETTVFEAGLRARGSEPPGTHPGETSFPTTTQTGTITFTSPDGVSKVELGGHVLTAAAQTFADGTTGLLTASFAYDPVTSQGVINYSYTLLDNTLGNPSSQSFEVAVTDADGDRTVGGDLLTIRVVDDGRWRLRTPIHLGPARSQRKPAMCSRARVRRRGLRTCGARMAQCRGWVLPRATPASIW